MTKEPPTEAIRSKVVALNWLKGSLRGGCSSQRSGWPRRRIQSRGGRSWSGDSGPGVALEKRRPTGGEALGGCVQSRRGVQEAVA